MWRLYCRRIPGPREHAVVQQGGQRHRSDAHSALFEEVAARNLHQVIVAARLDHAYSLVRVSSRLSKTLQTIVHAASSGLASPSLPESATTRRAAFGSSW